MFARVLIAVPLDEEFTYRIPQGMDVEVGRRVVVPFGSRQATGFVVAVEEEHPVDFRIRDITRLVDRKEPSFTVELIELARFVAGMYFCSAGQAISAMIPSGRRETESALFDSGASFRAIEQLSAQQESAIRTILSGRGVYYVYGVTGSGKSEVFLRVSEHVIAQGMQVIYLVPEITLTHQLSTDVMARFGGRVAILHSALTPSQRLRQWFRIMHHEVDLVIGARSAVYAPCAKLGLIIMDEEHENSYKSGSSPRYHARQVAQKRCEMNGVSFVMGSATPSMEAWAMMDSTSSKFREIPIFSDGIDRITLSASVSTVTLQGLTLGSWLFWKITAQFRSASTVPVFPSTFITDPSVLTVPECGARFSPGPAPLVFSSPRSGGLLRGNPVPQTMQNFAPGGCRSLWHTGQT